MENQNATEKTKNKSTVNKIILIVECVIIAICIVFTVFQLIRPGDVSEDGKDMRITMLPVVSDSMEPTIMTGSLITTKSVPKEGILDLGTIVTFAVYSPQGNFLNTHRIVAYQCRDKGGYTKQVYYKKGEIETVSDVQAAYPEYTIIRYITRGDKYTAAYGDKNLSDFSYSNSADILVTSYNDLPIEFDEVVAIYGSHIPVIGGVIQFLKTPLYFFLLILLPLILLFLYNVYELIRNIIKNNAEKLKAQLATSNSGLTEEEIKQKAIAEYLASQQQNAANAASSDGGQAEVINLENTDGNKPSIENTETSQIENVPENNGGTDTDKN